MTYTIEVGQSNKDSLHAREAENPVAAQFIDLDVSVVQSGADCLDDPWTVTGLQSTLESQRSWSLSSEKYGGGCGSSGIDTFTSRSRRKGVSNAAFFLNHCLWERVFYPNALKMLSQTHSVVRLGQPQICQSDNQDQPSVMISSNCQLDITQTHLGRISTRACIQWVGQWALFVRCCLS